MIFKDNKKFFLSIVILLSIILVLITLFSTLFFYKKLNKKLKKPSTIVYKYNFEAGESLYKVLEKQKISVDHVYKIINLLSANIPVKNVKPSQTYEIEKSTNGIFNAFSYCPSPIEKYRVYFSTITENYEIEFKKEELKTKIMLLEGEIKNSLYEAVVNNNGTANIAVEMTEIFAWQIDFFTDTRKGDKFEILYENLYTDSGYSKLGKILAAKYISKNYEYSAFYFNDGTDSGYYDEDGKAMKRAFLKSPLNYKRISSHFSGSRLHPILKYRRPHLGIDYAAAFGTPIVSIGDGRVTFIGRNSGYGKQIKIKHSNNYESWYAHLSRYSNISIGSKIKQGQLIGYVGQTGLATGPHLDFRFLKNGKFINYLAIKIPSASALKKEYMQDFEIKKNEYMDLLQTLKSHMNKRI